jgi:hypothetical protein
MIRDSPWLEPRSCAGVNCSSPSTRWPRAARCAAAALPIPPSPSTITSHGLLMTRSPGERAAAAQQDPASGHLPRPDAAPVLHVDPSRISACSCTCRRYLARTTTAAPARPARPPVPGLATLSDAVAVRRASATTADIGSATRPAAYPTTRMARPASPPGTHPPARARISWTAGTQRLRLPVTDASATVPVGPSSRQCAPMPVGSPLRSSMGTQRSDGLSALHSRSPIVPTSAQRRLRSTTQSSNARSYARCPAG